MALGKLAGELLPPNEGKDPTRWRWKVYITLMCTISVLAFHIAAEKGLIKGIDAVAHAGDVRSIESRLNSMEEKQNVALRLQLATEVCRLFRQRNEEINLDTRRLLSNAYSRLQEDYALVNRGVRYPSAECAAREQ